MPLSNLIRLLEVTLDASAWIAFILMQIGISWVRLPTEIFGLVCNTIRYEGVVADSFVRLLPNMNCSFGSV